jgi:hypothetical protein
MGKDVHAMKTIDDIEYEIGFIEKEMLNKDFPYLKQDELLTWLVALRWMLRKSSR